MDVLVYFRKIFWLQLDFLKEDLLLKTNFINLIYLGSRLLPINNNQIFFKKLIVFMDLLLQSENNIKVKD
jgi:hypothetical protein